MARSKGRRRPFKKDLTPIGRGGTIDRRVGKGATEQRTAPGERETLTSGGSDPMQRIVSPNSYPKNEPEPPPPVPMGTRSPAMPTAMMPPIGTGVPDEEV
jgi:hypothetical protein